MFCGGDVGVGVGVHHEFQLSEEYIYSRLKMCVEKWCLWGVHREMYIERYIQRDVHREM